MLKSKKGFTIVELVIVIAVIAILAAVLIPSFSSLNKKAKDSAYLQERTNQQIADLAEKVENQKFLTWEDLEAKLAEEIAKVPAGADPTEVENAIAKAIAKFENSLKTDDTALTEAQVKAIVEKALEGQLTTAQVEGIVTAAVKGIEITTNTTITEAQVKAIIDNAVAGLNKETGITAEEMETAISNALAAQDPTLTGDTVKGIINDALAGFGYGNDLSASQIENIINNAMAASKDKADVLAAEEMTTVIKAAGANTFEAAVEALTAAGYNVSALTPIRAGYVFCVTANEVKCVEADAIPEGGKDIVKEGAALVVADVKDVAGFEAALANGNSITLEADVELDRELDVPTGKKVTVDLNGNTITTAQVTGRSKYLNVNGELVIENGTIEARGITVNNGGKVVIGEDANLTIANVDSNGGACFWINAGGEVEINGGTFTALNGVKWGNETLGYSQNPGVINNSGKLTINAGTFKSAETICYLVQNSGEMVINGGTFEGTHGIIANYGTTAINGGTFTLKAYEDGTTTGYHIYCTSGTVTVGANAVFNGDVAYKEYTSGTGTIVK